MKKNAFTLVEMLTVILILGLLIGIATPKIQDYIYNKREQAFIINAKNIAREIEYNNIDVNSFARKAIRELDNVSKKSDMIDLDNSIVYFIDDEIYIDLVGINQYKNMYICKINHSSQNIYVQETPCQ